MNGSISILKQIYEKKLTNLQPEQVNSLIAFMLEHIGSTDSYIRDTLIYSSFSELILNDHLSNRQLIKIAETCSDDEHLFFDIHEQHGDAVFTRSFSALAIQLVLYKDCSKRFLPEGLATYIIEKSIDYLKYEHDYRGYIKNKGWAHSVAHGSDLLAQAIAHPLFSSISTPDAVLTILQKCLLTDYAYIDEEDERMMPVFDALFDKGLTEDDLIIWLQKLHLYKCDDGLKNYRIQWNIKKFMFTLYARLVSAGIYTAAQDWIYSHYMYKS